MRNGRLPAFKLVVGKIPPVYRIEEMVKEKRICWIKYLTLYDIWKKLCTLIDEKYEMERLWNKGGKTLCALYARENCIGFMIILGKDERLKFDTDRNHYTKEVQQIYDETKTWTFLPLSSSI